MKIRVSFAFFNPNESYSLKNTILILSEPKVFSCPLAPRNQQLQFHEKVIRAESTILVLTQNVGSRYFCHKHFTIAIFASGIVAAKIFTA